MQQDSDRHYQQSKHNCLKYLLYCSKCGPINNYTNFSYYEHVDNTMHLEPNAPTMSEPNQVTLPNQDIIQITEHSGSIFNVPIHVMSNSDAWVLSPIPGLPGRLKKVNLLAANKTSFKRRDHTSLEITEPICVEAFQQLAFANNETVMTLDNAPSLDQ